MTEHLPGPGKCKVINYKATTILTNDAQGCARQKQGGLYYGSTTQHYSNEL